MCLGTDLGTFFPILVLSILHIQNKLFKLLHIVNMLSWHIFQRILKYPASGFGVGFVIVQSKAKRLVKQQIINCHRRIIGYQGIGAVDKLIKLKTIVLQILILQIYNIGQHIFSEILWDLQIVLLNNYQHVIVLAEIVKSKQALFGIQNRNVKLVVQGFLI